MKFQEKQLDIIYKDFIAPLRTFIDLNFPTLHQDREDTLQEILEKLISRIHQYDSSYALSTWVYRVARNHCLDLLRKQKRKSSVSLENADQLLSPEIDPSEQVIGLEDQDRIRFLLKKLPSDERQVLFLKYFENMSFPEIGRVMNKPVGTLKYLSFKAKRWMEDHWEAAL